MKKLTIVVTFIICSISIYGQETNQNGPHGGIVISLDDFQIEMVKESYRCLSHPEIIGQKDGICTKCEAILERDKKIEFYLLDENFNALETTNLEGRVRIVFKDETASSKKIRISDNIIWIPLGHSGLSNYQQAIVKLKFNNKAYKATFGHPITHKGHHH